MALDLDQLAAEAEHASFEFTFNEETYELPGNPDYKAMIALQHGRIIEALELLLGPDQFDRIDGSDKTLGISQVVALIEAYAEFLGLTLGESMASSSSSKSTATRSRPTSKRTTGSRSRT